MTDRVDEYLAHYGIRGMKWGVRRSRGSNGRVSSASKGSSDFRSTKDLRKRPVHTLSNMQLKKVNERMQLESKFSQMNPTKVAKGKSFANDLLKATVGAGGVAAGVKLASNPKAISAIKRGAQVVRFRTSPQGRLLTKVAKGKFG